VPAALLVLVRTLLDIALLRLGPQDLPDSRFLLGLTLTAHALSVLLLSLAVHSVASSFLAGVVDTAVLVLLTLTLLYAQKLQQRLVQTLSALAGTGALLGFLALVPTWWWFLAERSGGDRALPWLLLLLLVVWSLLVMGHVLRHALSANLGIGLAVAAVFYWIAITVRDRLFPLPQ
jgi:hypothetical protein